MRQGNKALKKNMACFVYCSMLSLFTFVLFPSPFFIPFNHLVFLRPFVRFHFFSPIAVFFSFFFSFIPLRCCFACSFVHLLPCSACSHCLSVTVYITLLSREEAAQTVDTPSSEHLERVHSLFVSIEFLALFSFFAYYSHRLISTSKVALMLVLIVIPLCSFSFFHLNFGMFVLRFLFAFVSCFL